MEMQAFSITEPTGHKRYTPRLYIKLTRIHPSILKHGDHVFLISENYDTFNFVQASTIPGELYSDIEFQTDLGDFGWDSGDDRIFYETKDNKRWFAYAITGHLCNYLPILDETNGVDISTICADGPTDLIMSLKRKSISEVQAYEFVVIDWYTQIEQSKPDDPNALVLYLQQHYGYEPDTYVTVLSLEVKS